MHGSVQGFQVSYVPCCDHRSISSTSRLEKSMNRLMLGAATEEDDAEEGGGGEEGSRSTSYKGSPRPTIMNRVTMAPLCDVYEYFLFVYVRRRWRT